MKSEARVRKLRKQNGQTQSDSILNEDDEQAINDVDELLGTHIYEK